MNRKPVLLFTAIVLTAIAGMSTGLTTNSAATNIPPTPTPQTVVVLRAASQTQSVYSEPASLPTKIEVAEYVNGKAKLARIANVKRKLAKHLQALGINDSRALLDNPYDRRSREILKSLAERSPSKVISGDRLSGVHIANDLYLPKSLKLTGETVIIANRITFEGKDVSIRGPYDIFVVPIDSMVTTERRSKAVTSSYAELDPNSASYREQFFSDNSVVKGKVSIDVSGLGNREWLDARANRIGRTELVDDRSGAPGANGTSPAPQPQAPNGVDSPNPVDGTCDDTGPAGRDTPNATDGNDGNLGENAPDNATAGDNGGSISVNIPFQDADPTYEFYSRGGKGGDGGQGGAGGNGGHGGKGKRGGNGVTCRCVVGNGGKGGDAGKGGDGGQGGQGGNGANGGNGGTIVVVYPPNYNQQHIVTDVNGGDPGQAGARGFGGSFGEPGTPGVGGNPGPAMCGQYGTGGQGGAPKGFGSTGGSGLPGSAGQRGNDGVASVIPAQIGGGGGDGGGGGSPGCNPYNWVQYISYDGGQTWELYDSWYAGCW